MARANGHFGSLMTLTLRRLTSSRIFVSCGSLRIGAVAVPKISPVNVEVSFDGRSACISCENQGYRYHVWLDAEFKPRDTILYKNLPASSSSYKTIRLSTEAAFGKSLVDKMMSYAQAQDLFTKARAEYQLHEEEKRRKANLADILELKRDSAEEMFRLLSEVIKADVLDLHAADGLHKKIIARLCSIDETYDPMDSKQAMYDSASCPG